MEEKATDIKHPRNYIREHHLYGKSYDYKISKYNTQIHIYFDNDKVASQETDMYDTIGKYEEELKDLKILDKKQIKKYSKYYKIYINKIDNNFTYEKDYGSIEKQRQLLGYFACITNDIELGDSSVIDIYRRKDVIEKHFDNLKNYIDGNRLRTHSNSTFDGKMVPAQ